MLDVVSNSAANQLINFHYHLLTKKLQHFSTDCFSNLRSCITEHHLSSKFSFTNGNEDKIDVANHFCARSKE